MHSYSIDLNERQKIPFFISAFTILFTWGFYTILKKLNIEIPWWVDAPSVLGFYGIFYWVFNNFGWRWSLLKKLKLINTPILSGIWEGELSSSFGENKAVRVEIKQTWETMSVLLKTDQSKSCSKSAALTVLAPEGPALSYQYQNDPSHGAAQTMNIHYGTAQFTLDETGTKMEGEYYSGRGRQNTGSMSLVKR